MLKQIDFFRGSICLDIDVSDLGELPYEQEKLWRNDCEYKYTSIWFSHGGFADRLPCCLCGSHSCLSCIYYRKPDPDVIRYIKYKNEGFPLVVHISSDTSCNFKCKFCCYNLFGSHEGAVYEEFTKTPYYHKQLEYLKHAHHLVWGNGDFFHKQNTSRQVYIDYLNEDKSRTWSLVTNGYEFSIDKLKEWGVFDQLTWVQFSVYGSNNEAYKEVCGVEDGERVFRNFEALLREDNSKRDLGFFILYSSYTANDFQNIISRCRAFRRIYPPVKICLGKAFERNPYNQEVFEFGTYLPHIPAVL